MKKGIKKILLTTLGLFFVMLGAIGAVLPIMPTTVFLIIALWIFSKSSRRFHKMLLNNKWFGSGLRQWEATKTISRGSKKKAVLIIVLSFGVSIVILHHRIGLQLMLVGIALTLLTIIWTLKESREIIMRKCAILTMDKLDDFIVYDKKIDIPMASLGWQTSHISWHDKTIDWNQFEAVIIRSTWDYQDDAEAFMQVLSDIEQSKTILLNSLAIAQWNINKNYLREVEGKGADVIPTIWLEEFDFSDIARYFKDFKTDQIVIKPTVSANSDNTFWLKKDTYSAQEKLLSESLENRQLMVQPFISAIVEEGEYSLFYFAGKYSHCILKTPKQGDFRVQEEHGGILQSIKPSKDLLIAGNKALQAIPEEVLYARIDLVEHEGVYKLMEIELIEPSLYFNLDEKAAERFSEAFVDWMDKI